MCFYSTQIIHATYIFLETSQPLHFTTGLLHIISKIPVVGEVIRSLEVALQQYKNAQLQVKVWKFYQLIDSPVWKTNNICYAAFGFGAYFDELELIFNMVSLTLRQLICSNALLNYFILFYKFYLV